MRAGDRVHYGVVKMITDAQARIIFTIFREQGVAVGQTFTPREVFPAVTGQGSVDRERVLEMARVGLFGVRSAWDGERACELPGWGPVRLVMMREALRAYDEWARDALTPEALTPALSHGVRGEAV